MTMLDLAPPETGNGPLADACTQLRETTTLLGTTRACTRCSRPRVARSPSVSRCAATTARPSCSSGTCHCCTRPDQQDAEEIAQEFGGRRRGSWLAGWRSLNYARNVAAHHAQLFNRKFQHAPKGQPLDNRGLGDRTPDNR
jgi:hypothetical protein